MAGELKEEMRMAIVEYHCLIRNHNDMYLHLKTKKLLVASTNTKKKKKKKEGKNETYPSALLSISHTPMAFPFALFFIGTARMVCVSYFSNLSM